MVEISYITPRGASRHLFDTCRKHAVRMEPCLFVNQTIQSNSPLSRSNGRGDLDLNVWVISDSPGDIQCQLQPSLGPDFPIREADQWERRHCYRAPKNPERPSICISWRSKVVNISSCLARTPKNSGVAEVYFISFLQTLLRVVVSKPMQAGRRITISIDIESGDVIFEQGDQCQPALLRVRKLATRRTSVVGAEVFNVTFEKVKACIVWPFSRKAISCSTGL